MCNFLRKYLIVEPIIFFVFFANEIGSFATSNLYFQKACRDNTASAPDLNTSCDNEERGSDFLTTVFNSFALPGLFVSLFFTIFASTYSDLTKKRRIFIIAPIVGQLFKQLVLIAQTVFWSWNPLTGIVLGSIVECFSGGWLSLFNFIYACLFDRTSEESRLIRVTVQTVAQSVGTLLGKILAGFLLRKGGFVITFCTSFALYSMALVCTVFFLKEQPVTAEKKVSLKYVFNLKQIREMFVLIALPKRKPRKQIASIWLLLMIDLMVYFVLFVSSATFTSKLAALNLMLTKDLLTGILHLFSVCVMFCAATPLETLRIHPWWGAIITGASVTKFHGEDSVFYLYFRKRFHWNEEKFSLFSGYRNLSSTLGGVLCSFVMSYWLKIHDSLVGAFAAFWDTLAVIGFYFAREDWQLYLVPMFDIFHGLALTTCFSQMSKFFSEREFGRLNSMKMTFLTVGSSGGFVYSILYTFTNDTYPNAFFLLSIFLSTLICVLYSITYFLSRGIQISDPRIEVSTVEDRNHN